jgi:hypothetical protein
MEFQHLTNSHEKGVKSMKLVKLLAVILLIGLITFNFVPIKKAYASWWHDLSDSQRNSLILGEAQYEVGGTGGQCKTWIQNLVYYVSGSDLWLPSTVTDGGDSYYYAKWVNNQGGSPYCYVAWQGTLYCPASFENHGLQPGNIIQFRHDASGITPHTAVIEEISSNSLQVIDSNWLSDGVIRRHTISLSWWADHVEAWTAYQIK